MIEMISLVHSFDLVIPKIELVGDEVCHLCGALPLDAESAAACRPSRNSCRVADTNTLSAVPLERCV